MKRAENYELVLNEKSVIVIIEPAGDGYLVLLQGQKAGHLWRVKQGKFTCRHLESGREFGGTTRRDAATHMIYSIYRNK